MTVNGKQMTQDDLRKYEQGWAETMVDILHDRLQMLAIRDTGALYDSVRKHRVTDSVIEHRFLEYGIYVANGTGNGYRRGNGGDLQILDSEYRKHHGLRKRRKPRDWFFRKYFYSMHRLMEKEAEYYGDQYVGIVRELVAAQMQL